MKSWLFHKYSLWVYHPPRGRRIRCSLALCQLLQHLFRNQWNPILGLLSIKRLDVHVKTRASAHRFQWHPHKYFCRTNIQGTNILQMLDFISPHWRYWEEDCAGAYPQCLRLMLMSYASSYQATLISLLAVSANSQSARIIAQYLYTMKPTPNRIQSSRHLNYRLFHRLHTSNIHPTLSVSTFYS